MGLALKLRHPQCSAPANQPKAVSFTTVGIGLQLPNVTSPRHFMLSAAGGEKALEGNGSEKNRDNSSWGN